MARKKKKKSEAPGAQFFEVTMDNTEDQDELNRRMRKPGERQYLPDEKIPGWFDPPATGSQGKAAPKRRKNP